MLSHPKSTMRVLCKLTYWSSGHLTLLQGEFQPQNFSPSRTYGARRPHVGLCPIFLVYFVVYRFIKIIVLCTILT